MISLSRIKLFAALVLAWNAGLCLAPCSAEVTVSVRERVSINRSRITIGDVAIIKGGTANQQSHIAALDLEALAETVPNYRITSREIEARLLVAGYRRHQFHVTGARTVAIRLSKTNEFRQSLEGLMQREFARQFGIDAFDVSIRISGEEQLQAADARIAGDEYSATLLFDSQLPIGKTTVQVEFATLRERFSAEFPAQVILTTEVAVAARNVARGAVIDESSIRRIRRPIVRKADFADPHQLMGRVAKVEILKNDVVLTSYLTETTQNRSSVVQRNDLIDVVVPLGNAQVRLKNARVLRAGNIGDTITVLNTRSNNELSARVVSRTEAIVSNGPRTLQ